MLRLLPLLCLVACPVASDDSSPTADTDSGLADPNGDPATVTLAGRCPLASRWGGFEVEANKSYSVADGVITDGVVPVSILEETLSEGDCRLMKRNNPYCNPSCDSTETCDFDGTCIPYPTNQPLGTVTIAGLKESVSMDPLGDHNQYSFTKLSNPAFEPGALIELKTSGGAYAPLTLHGVGMAPLVPSSLVWVITEGQPLALTWDVPTGVVRSEVFLTVNVDQHGLTPANLECTFVDDGAAEVPASVMDALLGSGVTGYPSGRMQRRTVDKVQLGEGCADFTVDYEVLAEKVSVTGHTPCSEPDDCPEGLECNLLTQTCE